MLKFFRLLLAGRGEQKFSQGQGFTQSATTGINDFITSLQVANATLRESIVALEDEGADLMIRRAQLDAELTRKEELVVEASTQIQVNDGRILKAQVFLS